MANRSLFDILEIEREGIEIPFWDDTMKLICIYGIASAMSYLHSRNILHCDLKPNNILLDDFLFPKICDFSKSIKITRTFTTDDLQYMSPELFMDFKYTKKSDVYSFAIICYYILVNQTIIKGVFSFIIVDMIVTHNYRPEINDKIPIAYKTLIESCWNQDPSKRPSFQEIVDQLRENPIFLTDKINETLYKSYINYIDQQMQMKGHENFTPNFPKYTINSMINSYFKLMKLKSPLITDIKKIDLNCFEKNEVIGYGGFGKVFKIQRGT